jgi:hypothetical protein
MQTLNSVACIKSLYLLNLSDFTGLYNVLTQQARSKARVCGRSFPGIAGSIPGGPDACLLQV